MLVFLCPHTYPPQLILLADSHRFSVVVNHVLQLQIEAIFVLALQVGFLSFGQTT